MKENIVIFERDIFLSGTSGGIQVYRCRPEIRKKLGQAKSIRWQIFGFRRSTNARAVLKMWETPVNDMAPSEVIPGGTPFNASAAIVSLRPVPATITGPFADNVEFTLEIDASTGSAQEEFELMVVATLILEE